jgi:HSP20 family protein
MPQHRNGTRTRRDDAAGALVPYSGSPGLMTQIRDEFDRLFDRFMRQGPGMGLAHAGEQPWHWGLDVQDEDNAVAVRAELPGFDADDIDLQVNGHRLVIRAAHKSETAEPKGRSHQWQRREYYQAVPLPADVDPDQTDAHYRNGVLSVHLPKTEQGKGRRVAIRKE